MAPEISLSLLAQIAAGLALAFSLVGFGLRLKAFRSLAQPSDRALPGGSSRAGRVYALTLGMAPWAKESTRLHRTAYLRGVAFHLGIFLGLGILFASPWLTGAPAIWRAAMGTGAALGALLGFTGLAARFMEPNLKALNTLDDLVSVALVSLFLATASAWLFAPALEPVFYLASAVMLVYAPFSKIRHCLYFAYSRLAFGKFSGSRGVLPHSQQAQVYDRRGGRS
jgi:hypothetical protein